jgi:hypothetical protein
MRFSEPPTYTVQELEHKARQFLASQFGQDVPVPVDIDLLIEQLPGVDLDYWPGLRDNHGLEGMVCREVETGEVLVFIDESLADTRPARYRMTVAEELGHIVLHRSVIDQVLTPEDFEELQRHHRWHEMDRNAKRFAAAVLMPGAQLIAEAQGTYPQLVRAVGFANVQAIKKQLAFLLAKRFEVSQQSMTIRLTEWPMRVYERVEAAVRDQLDFLE